MDFPQNSIFQNCCNNNSYNFNPINLKFLRDVYNIFLFLAVLQSNKN